MPDTPVAFRGVWPWPGLTTGVRRAPRTASAGAVREITLGMTYHG